MPLYTVQYNFVSISIKLICQLAKNRFKFVFSLKMLKNKKKKKKEKEDRYEKKSKTEPVGGDTITSRGAVGWLDR